VAIAEAIAIKGDGRNPHPSCHSAQGALCAARSKQHRKQSAVACEPSAAGRTIAGRFLHRSPFQANFEPASTTRLTANMGGGQTTRARGGARWVMKMRQLAGSYPGDVQHRNSYPDSAAAPTSNDALQHGTGSVAIRTEGGGQLQQAINPSPL